MTGCRLRCVGSSGARGIKTNVRDSLLSSNGNHGFVHPFNQQRHPRLHAGNLIDYMQGRVRLMTALVLAKSRACQALCKGNVSEAPLVPFTCPRPGMFMGSCPQKRTTTRFKGVNFRGCAICTDGETGPIRGDNIARCGAIVRSLNADVPVMFGPVLTTLVDPAFAGVAKHSKNTRELSAFFEALRFIFPAGLCLGALVHEFSWTADTPLTCASVLAAPVGLLDLLTVDSGCSNAPDGAFLQQFIASQFIAISAMRVTHGMSKLPPRQHSEW